MSYVIRFIYCQYNSIKIIPNFMDKCTLKFIKCNFYHTLINKYYYYFDDYYEDLWTHIKWSMKLNYLAKKYHKISDMLKFTQSIVVAYVQYNLKFSIYYLFLFLSDKTVIKD